MTINIIVRQTIRECFLQPLFLFIVLIELAVTLIILFGFDIRYEQGIPVSVRLLGGNVRDQLPLVIDSLSWTGFTLTTQIIAFLLILLAASCYSDLLRDPLLGILLTKSVSRTGLFVGKFAGVALCISSNILLFSIIISVVLGWKTGGSVLIPLILGSSSFCFEFLLLFSLCSFLTMIVDHPFAIAVVVIGIYYLVGPLVAGADPSLPLILKVVSMLLPPTGTLSWTTREMALHGAQDYSSFGVPLLYTVVCLVGGALLFRRKDLG